MVQNNLIVFSEYGKNNKVWGEVVSDDIIPYADVIVDMIEQARQNALRSVNAELITLYWNVASI